MGLPRQSTVALLFTAVITTLLVTPSYAGSNNRTSIHEAGRCAIRGNCGSEGFGPQLPCPDNDVATEPTNELRTSLVDICGDEWSEGKVCCTLEQLEALKTNLQRANTIIASCPAC